MKQSTPTTRWRPWSIVFLAVVLAASVAPAQSPDPEHGPAEEHGPADRQAAVGVGETGQTVVPSDSLSVEHWIVQLSDDDYLRRERAHRRLLALGARSVDRLGEAIGQGDLETIQRASSILTQIATTSDPASDGGAWQRLVDLSKRKVGMVAVTARQATEEIRQHRAIEAVDALREAGIFIQTGPFSVGFSVLPSQRVVKIDGGWNGETERLQWLRWVSGVETVTIVGPAITPEVLGEVTKMPDLKSLAIIDDAKPLRPGVIDKLMNLKSIEQLEFRYVRLSDADADRLCSIPVQEKLSLTGSGLSDSKVESLQSALPEVELEHRRGGFLGIHSFGSNDICQISKVIRDSAAAEGGLISGDVITAVDGTPVERFHELQEIIGQHSAGEELTVEYQRGAKRAKTVVRLRRHVSN